MDLPQDALACRCLIRQIVDKANAAIPLELQFTRSDGAKVKLGDLFQSEQAGDSVVGLFFLPESVQSDAG